jgi:alkaline phosphatase
MKKNALLMLLIFGSCAHAAPASTPAPTQDDEVRNIILLIVDGASAAMWSAASYAREDLAIARMPVAGLVDTRSASAKVTDSAAGATVYAAGERVPNRTVGVRGTCPLPSPRNTAATEWPEGCEPVETWFHLAQSKGRAAGVVTTTNIVDATPASFVAHSPSRYWGQYIAEQFAEAGLDVMLGGGRSYFEAGTRADGRDLLGEMCARAACLWTASDLAAYRARDDRPLVGLFAPGDMDAMDSRPVTLPAMVTVALDRLSRNSRGFVAMFESEAIDNATHSNEPLERITADMLEFDDAVRVALDFAERTPGTLVIVTSDHDTGGFSLIERGTDFEVGYTTRGHTATAVPLFAYGPLADRFGGWRRNDDIGRTLMEIVRRW